MKSLLLTTALIISASTQASSIEFSNYAEYREVSKVADGTYYFKAKCVDTELTKVGEGYKKISRPSVYLTKETISKNGSKMTIENFESDGSKTFTNVAIEMLDENTKKMTSKTLHVFTGQNDEIQSNESTTVRVRKMVNGESKVISTNVNGEERPNVDWVRSVNYLNKKKTEFIEFYKKMDLSNNENMISFESTCYVKAIKKKQFQKQLK